MGLQDVLAGVATNVAGNLVSQGLNSLTTWIAGGQDRDPEIPYYFMLEIGGISCVRFKEVDGLKMTTAVTHYREGGNNLYEHALIEGQKFESLKVRKGFYGASIELYTWMSYVHDSSCKVTKQSISMVVQDDTGEETCRFNLFNAFPISYRGPKFDATAKEVAFEEIEIQYDYFTLTTGGFLGALAGAAIGSIAGMAVGAAQGAAGGLVSGGWKGAVAGVAKAVSAGVSI
jgi:phage tail-like protein